MKSRFWLIGAVCTAFLASVTCKRTASNTKTCDGCEFKLTSSSFDADEPLPRNYTCDGEGLSVELAWSGIPEGTKSLALIVYAIPPRGAQLAPMVHWLLYDIPPSVTMLAEGASASTLPQGTKQGLNYEGNRGYIVPCPTDGRFRYVHRLYAFDNVIGDLEQPTMASLEQVMGDTKNTLAETWIVGTYERQYTPGQSTDTDY